jgi:YD repeat-containing protein
MNPKVKIWFFSFIICFFSNNSTCQLWSVYSSNPEWVITKKNDGTAVQGNYMTKYAKNGNNKNIWKGWEYGQLPIEYEEIENVLESNNKGYIIIRNTLNNTKIKLSDSTAYIQYPNNNSWNLLFFGIWNVKPVFSKNFILNKDVTVTSPHSSFTVLTDPTLMSDNIFYYAGTTNRFSGICEEWENSSSSILNNLYGSNPDKSIKIILTKKWSISNGVLDGCSLEFEDEMNSDKVIQKTYFTKGNLDSIENFDNEQLIQKRFFVNNKENGITKSWYESGKLMSQYIFVEGKKHGLSIMFHPNDTKYMEGLYKDDLQEGIWNEWYTNGKVRVECQYILGQLDGEIRYFFENGKIQESGNYIKGLLNGNWKNYDDQGNLISIKNYQDGKKEGMWYTYHKNGKTSSETFYNTDLVVGEIKKYDDNGVIILHVNPELIQSNQNQSITINHSSPVKSKYHNAFEGTWYCNCYEFDELFYIEFRANGDGTLITYIEDQNERGSYMD